MLWWPCWYWSSHEISPPGCIFWVINTAAVESGSPIFKCGVNQEERDREECVVWLYCCPHISPPSHSSHSQAEMWLSQVHYIVCFASNNVSKYLFLWSVSLISKIQIVLCFYFCSPVRLIKFADCLRDMRIISHCVLCKREGLGIGSV